MRRKQEKALERAISCGMATTDKPKMQRPGAVLGCLSEEERQALSGLISEKMANIRPDSIFFLRKEERK